MTQTQSPVSREILTYLGKLPQILHKQGNSAAADVALALGNCLLWIQPNIAPGEHKVEAGLDETAHTIYALGKQFRAIALAFMDKPGASNGRYDWQFQTLVARVDELTDRLHKVERGEQ